MNEIIVTTAGDPTPELQDEARKISAELEGLYLERGRQSLASMVAGGAEQLLVVGKNGMVVHTPGGQMFFHLSMAQLRLKNVTDGKSDHMAEAMGLGAGDSVLDCTLGLATDAIVASYLTGAAGRVQGIEASTLLFFLVREGLKNFDTASESLNAALRRIGVVNADSGEYLRRQPAKSWDIVFFDPMFRQPVYRSSALKPLRFLADKRPLTEAMIAEACRVARRRVVIKEASGSEEFARLGCRRLAGGKYSSVAYGIIDCDD
ncbi:MAG TPA: class I SAM-dependent methyltransferase [Patescibacteria group bacterium]|nr:class I SAM-dependent methyltransferase [Patescibacteria group bacterium]